MTKSIQQILIYTIYAFIFAGSISIIRSTAAQGGDFIVFWKSARFVLQGNPLYSTLRDGGMVYKYPPWIIPFFFPLALLPLQIAKWIWGVFEVGSILYIFNFLRTKLCLKQWTCIISLICFWGLWIIHALDGQISLIMLFLSLYLIPQVDNNELKSSSRFFKFNLVLLFFSLSTKIFTLVPFLGIPWKRKDFKLIGIIILFCFLFSLPAVWTEPKANPITLLQTWSKAASSGGQLLESGKVRSQMNAGFPSYLLRTCHIKSADPFWDIGTAILCIIFFGGLWFNFSKKLPFLLQWIGWLGLTPVVHPLPWWHLFVFTFPLATYNLDQAISKRNKLFITLSICSIFLISMSTQKLLGTLGTFLEMNGAKSWGTLLGLVILFKHSRITRVSN